MQEELFTLASVRHERSYAAEINTARKRFVAAD
jgi:hypothetical protein